MQTEHVVVSGSSTVLVDPVFLQSPLGEQAVIFTEVRLDDAAVLESGEGEWLRVLLHLDWREYRDVAAKYYQALWEFNVEAARKRGRRIRVEVTDQETQGEGTLRLLFERPTSGNAKAPILHPTPIPPIKTPTLNPLLLAPGVVPIRVAGKTPKCFFALFKAFTGLHLMGKSGSAQEVAHHLRISPTFARACGFTVPHWNGRYRYTDIPSLRKLEQFDQIMSARGLWNEAKVKTIGDNLSRGIIDLKGQDLVHDTTHYVAYSEAVGVTVPPGAAALPQEAPFPETSPASSQAAPPTPSKAPWATGRQAASAQARSRWRQRRRAQRRRRRAQARNKALRIAALALGSQPEARPRNPGAKGAGSDKTTARKMQSRTVKLCRCTSRASCPHPWVQSDPGAGTVVKGTRKGGKRWYWAHKAAVLSTGPGGIPLAAQAMSDGASHDRAALVPQLENLFSTYPALRGKFRNALADKAYDDDELKEIVEERFHINLKTHANPRGRKIIGESLGRGVKSLSPMGTLTCQADRNMSYLGVNFATERFLYGPPHLENDEVACLDCPLRSECLRVDTRGGRYTSVKFDQLPHFDPADPPMARRFKAIMRRRTAVERAIKRIKLDFGSDRLTRRGNDAFQAHLDRSLIAFHLMLRLRV